MRSRLHHSWLWVAVLAAGVASAEPLVGPSVGNAEVLRAEAQRLYSSRQYSEAADAFLRATRANPAQLASYLGLARARLGAQRLGEACLAYRAYLRAMPESSERTQAQHELEVCERLLKSQRKLKAPPDPTTRNVELKAAFFSALEKESLLGAGSAEEALRALVANDYLAPDLAGLAERLHTAARTAVETLHTRALAGEQVEPQALLRARALHELARDTGEPLPQQRAQLPFLEGLAALRSGEAARARELLAEAAAAVPSRPEYHLFHASALYKTGDTAGALRVLEAELPEDVRTLTLRAEVALRDSPEAGAGALEALLFQRYFDLSR